MKRWEFVLLLVGSATCYRPPCACRVSRAQSHPTLFSAPKLAIDTPKTSRLSLMTFGSADTVDSALKSSSQEPEELPPSKFFPFRFPKFNVSATKVASLGASAALAYSTVSNLNMGICAMISFATFGKSTGLSPLAPGQWPKFAAVYAGYWIAMNFLRPARLALAVGLSPLFDRLMGFLQGRLRIPKAAAFGLIIFTFNIVGNLAFLLSGLLLTSRIMGIPLFPS